MAYDVSYISCNSNHTPGVVHWGKNDLICYGSCRSILIWNPHYGSGGKVISTLSQHKARVNSVRWITGCEYETELVSGSSDGTAIVWTYSEDKKQYLPNFLKGHNLNVNIVDGIYKNKDTKSVIVVTASVDSTVRIWCRLNKTGDFSQSQVLDFGHGLCVGVRISYSPQGDGLILACALDNSKIKLYLEGSEAAFQEVRELEGHEDWVRGLDFTVDAKGDLLLASSSQDTFIRLWRITFSEELKNITEISLESVLAGHEGWVYSVNWNPKCLQLLSASLDKTMIVWEFDPNIGLWFEKVRVGEVGGNTLGFYGGIFSPSGSSILAHSYHGAFHIWNCASGKWEPAVTVGGHFGEVVDLGWEPNGEFVVTASVDQTTRIHAPWPKNDDKFVTWHEIARPQVHGYDMSCLAIISRYKFASGAEEKVIRTFQAPANFVDNLRRICKLQMEKDNDDINTSPKGASVPSLGLSNKAVYEDSNKDVVSKKSKDAYLEESHFTAMELTEPPTEETLLQNTLWPEIQKLYGHGYEVYSLAASGDGQLLASACKATNTEHAAVLIWDTSSWKQIQKLPSHNLTIAQLSFSPDSLHLLSVSRDRRWSLFQRDPATNELVLTATVDKKTSIHARIIWCCAWAHSSQLFATGSRDGKVVVWGKNEKISENITERYVAASEVLELKGESVTAVAFAPGYFEERSYLIALGLDVGSVVLYRWNLEGWIKLSLFDNSVAHHLTVRRLSFRPVYGKAGEQNEDSNVLQLASCSADYSVRVYTLYLDKLKSF